MANRSKRTEHAGAKKGRGAYYGRKREAKRDSDKRRRRADDSVTAESLDDTEPTKLNKTTTPTRAGR